MRATARAIPWAGTRPAPSPEDATILARHGMHTGDPDLWIDDLPIVCDAWALAAGEPTPTSPGRDPWIVLILMGVDDGSAERLSPFDYLESSDVERGVYRFPVTSFELLLE